MSFLLVKIFNIEINPFKENSLFLKLKETDKNAKKLYEVLIELRKKTFGELIKELEKYGFELPFELREVLIKLNIFHRKVSYEKFLELKYFINNFKKEIKRRERGVLIRDFRSSTFIDRDIILLCWNG